MVEGTTLTRLQMFERRESKGWRIRNILSLIVNQFQDRLPFLRRSILAFQSRSLPERASKIIRFNRRHDKWFIHLDVTLS